MTDFKSDLKSSVLGSKWKLAEPLNNFEDNPDIKEKIDPELDYSLKTIQRGPLGIPSYALKAAAFHYYTKCGEVNNEFVLCKNEEMDPRNCLKYNNKVSDCARDFFFEVTNKCGESFTEFSACLERSTRRHFTKCRRTQLAFDKCMFERLGIDKVRYPEFGATVKTDRPKPKNPLNLPPLTPDQIYPDFSRNSFKDY